MKRIFICLLIATFSITGLYAQDKDELQAKQKQEQDLKAYKQQQEQELQKAIREQTQLYISEAAKSMEATKRKVQKDREARREQLMHRPEGMAPLSEKVKIRLNL